MFGRIAYIETTSGGQLQSGEKYGWIMNAYDAEDGSDYIVEIMTQEGKSAEYKLGSSVDYWAPTATAATTLSSKEEAKSTVSALMSNDSFVKLSTSTTTPIRLVKYKTNSSNAITRLYCAVDSSKVSNENALRINTTNLKNAAAINGSVKGYKVADGIVEFSAPLLKTDMTDAANYKVGTATASAYVVKENGSSRDFVLGEFKNSINATIVINFTASANDPAKMTDMDSAGSGPEVMVVDEISRGVDDDDNTVYTIDGYVGSTDVSITTNKNTNVGVLTSALWTGSNNGRNFDAPTVWNAVDNEYADIDLGSILKTGDIILYTGDGKLIAKFADAEGFADHILNSASYTLPTGSRPNKSSSRVKYYFNALVDSDLDENAWVKIKDLDDSILFDSSMLMDLVTISANGSVDIDQDGATVSDLIPYDEKTKTGDFLFISIVNKGDMGKMIVYRFE